MDRVPETVATLAAYQIFINHRGPDVKRNLASLIYHRFRSMGLSVFLDEQEIQTGDTLSAAILGAIRSAYIHIAIFSEKYAESRWCLEELCLILKSVQEGRSIIIPLFCDVEPSDLRYIQKGLYAKSFEDHEQKGRVTMDDIKSWKTALEKASHISGILFRKNERKNESDFGETLEKIVKIVMKEVFRRDAHEMPDKYEVGLEEQAKDFQNEILTESHSNATTIVGIAGMSGIGKSTLARYLYRLRRSDFTRSCILCDVRNTDLLSLQKKLLWELLGNYSLPVFSDRYEGKRILRASLSRLQRRIFIVLDDVDRMDQLDLLLDLDAVPSGSLIFITSHDKVLLNQFSANTRLYDVKVLPNGHARELFCRYAFRQCKPPEELKDLVDECLQICGGLPLSLRVLGGLFVGQYDRDYWEKELAKFRLPKGIKDPLEVSYEALNPEEKEVFLDIGCFLAGEKKELAVQVLEGLHGRDYLRSLHQKCLVYFHFDVQSDDEIDCSQWYNQDQMIRYNDCCWSLKIRMHPQLRELARQIVRDEFQVLPMRRPLRLSSSEDILDMMRSPVARSNLEIRGIRYSNVETPEYLARDIRDIRVEGVCLFVVEGFSMFSSAFRSWTVLGELVWLRLYNVHSFHFLRFINLRRLRVLEIRGDGVFLEELFEELFRRLDSEGTPSLNELNIEAHSSSLWNLNKLNIEESSSPWNLNELNIDTQASASTSGGKNLEIQKQVEETGSSIQAAQRGSYFFRDLGSYIFRYLYRSVTKESLTKLKLKNLAFFPSLPIEFSRLQNLRHLDLSGCSSLTELPNSFSRLLQLRYLALQDCKNLSIPRDLLGEISTLEYVNFKGCAKLVALPHGIPYQRHLRYLNLLCTGLLQLPENFELLDNLEQLTIGSQVLTELPLSISNLRGLKKLFLIKCSRLRRISPEGIAAPNMQVLAIDGCPIANFSFQDQGRVGMSSLRDFTLKNTDIYNICIPEIFYPILETIDLSLNSRLMQVDSLPSTLASLSLQGCRALETLRSLSNLVNLKFLNVNCCCALEILIVEGLASLKELEASECWELGKIEGLRKRNRLNNLYISTENIDTWNDICEYLRSPFQKPSIAIFSGPANDDAKRYPVYEEMPLKFNLQMHNISNSSRSIKLENVCSYGAILMFFVANDYYEARSTTSIDITFELFNGSKLCYKSLTGWARLSRWAGVDLGVLKCDGQSFHVFMWTEGSPLFKEKNTAQVNFSFGDARVSTGWMAMVDKDTNVSEVCREFFKLSGCE